MNSAEFFPLFILLSLVVEMHMPAGDDRSIVGIANVIFLVGRITGWVALCMNKRISWGRVVGLMAFFMIIMLSIKGLTLSAIVAVETA